MKKLSASFAAGVLLAVFSPPSPGAPPLPAGRFEVECGKGTVTVRANDVSVPELLAEFSRKSGIAFNKYVGRSPRVSLDLENVKIDEFLNRVLGSYVTKSRMKNGVPLVSAVTIMDNGDEGGASPPPPPPLNDPPQSEQEKSEEPQRPADSSQGPAGEEAVSTRIRRRARLFGRHLHGESTPSAPGTVLDQPPLAPPEGEQPVAPVTEGESPEPPLPRNEQSASPPP